MSDEIKVEDWYDVDKNNYARIHSYDLGRLIQQANGSYAMLEDLNKAITQRNIWRATAEVLAIELGKVEYAYVEYENQKEAW